MTKVKRNLTEGPIFIKLLLFVLPIMATGIIQLLYGMADNIIVGRFSGDDLALAAVGSTGSLNNLIINLMIGTSAGSGVVVAQLFGAGREREVSRAVHTALLFAFMLGIVLSAIGILVARPALILMGTKAELLDRAVLYLRIICLGIPGLSVFNFGASILRAVGDSRTPLIILICTGLINVVFNLIFVLGFGMAVDGVAIATIISQYLSAITVVFVLIRRKSESYAFSFSTLCFDQRLLRRILRIGIPTGLQGAMFSISNIVVTSAINTFPTTTVSAAAISSNIDSITYVATNSFQQAAMNFSGQNFGAKKFKRLKAVLWITLIQVVIVGLIVGYTEILFGEQLASLYISADDPNRDVIIDVAMEIMVFLLSLYFLCGVMESLVGYLRGMGYSISPAIISLAGIFGVRIPWIKFVFPLERFNNIVGLYVSYPITWVASIIGLAIVCVFAMRKMNKIEKLDELSAKKAQTD